MPGCPACGSEVPPDALECPRCHLAVHLFEPVREAVGVPESDPRYASELAELMAAVEPSPAPGEDGKTGPAVLAYPARFPSPPARHTPMPEGPAPPTLDTLPSLPALPSGGVAGLRRQIDEQLQVARRQNLDVDDLMERSKESLALDDPRTLEVVARELFVRLAAALSEAYEATVAARNALANLVPTSQLDQELVTVRMVLLQGDLAGAQARLTMVREELAELQESWETVQILLTECDLLAGTIRELGGDPGPALGPFEEGRRLAQSGIRQEAEPVLAKATVALWAVLNPRFGPEMHRIKDALLARRRAGADVSGAIEEFRELAAYLAKRNFGATVLSYRRLRDFVDASPPKGDELPPAGPAAPSAPTTAK